MALEFTDQNFEELVLNSDKPVLVDFWAVWCGPCRTIGPIVDELHDELEGQAVIGKVDVDSNSDTSGKYGVRNIPTLLVFKNGDEYWSGMINTDFSDSYNPNAYIDPVEHGFEKANQGAIIPVNISSENKTIRKNKYTMGCFKVYLSSDFRNDLNI